MRSDMLISVGVVDEDGPRRTLPRLKSVIAELAVTFRYYELVYVVRESARAEIDAIAAEILNMPNLRIVLTSEGTRFYRQRLIAAMEAIGDVVAVYDLDDMPVSALVGQIVEAKNADQVRIGWRSSRPLNGWGYRLLALASNNNVSARAARTIILPRRQINELLGRKSASIDLRFEARNVSTPYQHFEIASPSRSSGRLGQRYELLIEILLAGAPRFLKLYALLGFFVVLGAFCYGVFAVGVWLLRDHVTEGWLSTAIIQAGSTGFIAAGMSILSLALVAVIEVLSGGNSRMIVDEISNINFFNKVTDLNIEMSGELELDGGKRDIGNSDHGR